MQELQLLMKASLKYLLYIMALFVLGWGFTDYKTVFAGLILGMVVGLFNVWLLAKRTMKIGQAAVEGKKAKSVGSISRYASAILATMIALEFPEHFSIIGTVLGLVTTTVVVIIVFIIQKYNVNNEEER
ncbi:ATP synthase subunit I [Bacillus massiliigorillae]|uniref:ATP synthase subunit I n=1 Tax=Bacillus massiliigorillae TaxID=1243664 RepID=UPI0003A59F72|nr:ATP synthase subunit I [Bacillus massiliigorillae]